MSLVKDFFFLPLSFTCILFHFHFFLVPHHPRGKRRWRAIEHPRMLIYRQAIHESNADYGCGLEEEGKEEATDFQKTSRNFLDLDLSIEFQQAKDNQTKKYYVDLSAKF